MVSQAELILRVITLWFLVLSQFFRDGMGPFNALESVKADIIMTPMLKNINSSFHSGLTIFIHFIYKW